MERVQIRELMETSGVKFGTSGARGLVSDLSDRVAYAYAAGFLKHLAQKGSLPEQSRVVLAGDRRSSTPRIKSAVAKAVIDAGCEPVDGGLIPSPAVALFGLEQGIPSIMITGSHIPDDRNGIKFNTPTGEILKEDEAGIAQQEIALPSSFDASGALAPEARPNLSVDPAPRTLYVNRYLQAFPKGVLEGSRVGVYGHSAVGRELVQEILEGLGARVTRLGYSDAFVSVDTEAIRPEDVELARYWADEVLVDSIVSTDGDSDRPLISDERGRFVRGDVAGILCAKYLGASTVVTPVSSNSAVERSGWFRRVIRTRIGSPYVIAAMNTARAEGDAPVVGYEANGGFLTASPIVPPGGGTLNPLPTRDAVLIILAVLVQARARSTKVSELLTSLPPRFTASDRLPEFPTEKSRPKLEELARVGAPAVRALLGDALGPVRNIDTTDGVRIEFESADIVHVRVSGNAPELRCYAEASTDERARELTRLGLSKLERWR